MSESTQWHYTDKTGQQAGPVSTDALIQLILSKEIPTTSMVWKDGMASWKTASQIEELHTAPSATKATTMAAVTAPESATDAPLTNTAKPASTTDPYETPQSTKLAPPPEIPLSYDELHGDTQSYEGIGRLSYIFLRPLLYLIIFIPLLFGILIFLNSELIGSSVILLLTILFIRLHCLRFKNIGMNPWWTLALIIPIVNLPLYLILNICPAGYAYTKKLDIAGKILAFFFIGIPILFIVLSILFDMGTAFTRAAEKAKETIDQQRNKQEKVQPPAQ
jgi:hypothetical protein